MSAVSAGFLLPAACRTGNVRCHEAGFVFAYRCGAVPDLHRIPSYGCPSPPWGGDGPTPTLPAYMGACGPRVNHGEKQRYVGGLGRLCTGCDGLAGRREFDRWLVLLLFVVERADAGGRKKLQPQLFRCNAEGSGQPLAAGRGADRSCGAVYLTASKKPRNQGHGSGVLRSLRRSLALALAV